METPNVLRDLALITAALLEQSIVERERFMEFFKLERSFQSLLYEEHHKVGKGMSILDQSGLSQPEKKSWVEEAQTSGEIFTGRPVVRPRIDFGTTSKDENSKQCTKVYKASTAFSSGIFTVQCVCKFPKLLGISIMENFKGVSTALSVLLSRFEPLPRCLYYDNACNLGK